MTTTTTEQSAFEALYATCRDGIERHVRSMIRAHPDEAEDILQFTWLKVWRSWHSSPYPSYKWIERIATNTALDYLRTYTRHREIRTYLSLDAYLTISGEKDKQVDPQEAIQGGPADVSESVIAQESVEAWLRPLKPHYQQIIALTAAGYTSKEIGARVTNKQGKHQGYYEVKMTLHRARARARKERDRQERMEARPSGRAEGSDVLWL